MRKRNMQILFRLSEEEADPCRGTEGTAHVHADILHLATVFKLGETGAERLLLSVQEHIQDGLLFGIGKEALIFLAVRIPLEFVNGKCRRKRS